MSKPSYADYVNMMLRFYARTRLEYHELPSNVDRENWWCAMMVVDDLPEFDRRVIMEVYSRRDTLADNVYEVSKELKVKQDVIWTIISKVSKDVAKRRGLI